MVAIAFVFIWFNVLALNDLWALEKFLVRRLDEISPKKRCHLFDGNMGFKTAVSVIVCRDAHFWPRDPMFVRNIIILNTLCS